MKTCTECDDPHYARGLCSRHYQLARYHERLPEVTVDRVCQECGGPIEGRHWRAQFCSRACNDKNQNAQKRAKVDEQRPKRTANCEQCDTEFTTRRADRRFCSGQCGAKARNAAAAARLVAGKTGRPPCETCGKPIDPERSSKVRFCSVGCRSKGRRHQTYGLTSAELAQLLEAHPVCAICGTERWGKKGPQVDHDHATGRVRGVLCNNCNNGLGRFRDDPGRLRAAVAYLER